MSAFSFTGFDIDGYPGDAALRDAAAQGISWCASYLEAPSHSNASWPDYPTLIATGLNILPIWVGAQVVGPGSHDVGGAQGATEARACVAELTAKSYPAEMGVVFDTENGPPVPDLQTQHLTAWRDGVRAGGYRAMVYGSHLNFDALAAIFGAENIWEVELRSEPQPDFRGVAVQYQQEVPLVLAGQTLSVDRSVSIVADPAAPFIAQPIVVAQPVIPAPRFDAGMPPPPAPIPPVAPAQPKSPITASQGALAIGAGSILAAGTASITVHNMQIDLTPILNPLIVLAGLVLTGFASWAMTRVAAYAHVSMQSAQMQTVLGAVDRGISYGASKATAMAAQDATVNVADTAQTEAAKYVVSKLPGTLKSLGITPAGVSDLILAKLPPFTPPSA